jgi:ligand-binding SRPBCC domain-containing protein
MVTIRTVTWIDAPVERCFLLARSVDFQLASSKYKKVKIVAGVQSGLLELGDTVTWQGRMFGLGRSHTNRVEILRPSSLLSERMVVGGFKFYEHERHFAAMDDGTRIKDEVRFSAGWGPVGWLAEPVILRRRVAALLRWRNEALKEVAESDVWKHFLEGRPGVGAQEPEGRGERPGTRTEAKSHFFAH